MNLFLFHFRVPNWELRNKKLHFELLTPWSNFYFFAYLRLKIKFPFESLTQWVDFHFLTFELWNTQVDKTFSVNKGSAKICLVVGVVKKNWSWIVVASCGLHYFVSACFGSFWVFANSTAERFKYLLFSSMKIHIMACIVKKQNNFILSCLVT